MLKDHKEVIKHSAAIQISNEISLLQRKAWNVLFANAYSELPTQEVHYVNVQELMDALDYESTNQRHLKKSIKDLVTNGVEWNVLEKDKVVEWGVTTLLAQAKIKDGVCSYAYSPEMRERLHSPAMYARISLELQNKFGSKHALALFELFRDYFDDSRQYGETPWIEIPRFRKLMGIPDGKYKEFKILNKWVIKDPVKEIQSVTHYVIDVEYKRQGRKVVAVKFKIRYVPKIANDTEEQGGLFVDTEGLPELAVEMVKTGVHRNKAMQVWSQGFKGVRNRPKGQQDFADYVQEKLDLLQQEAAKGKVGDKAAWLIAAIRDNYQHPTYRKRKHVAEIKEKIAQLETEAKRLKYDRGKREAEILEPLLADEAELGKGFEQWKKSPLFQEDWNKYADNLREGIANENMFAAGIKLAIKQEHIDKFAALDNYQQSLEKTESQIVQLKAKLRR